MQLRYPMLETTKQIGNTKLTLCRGNITHQVVDAIVNAANSGLYGGGGVDGAIHAAGGPSIMAECVQIRKLEGGCPTGQAVITGGGNLKVKYVIHAVGPKWRGGSEDEAKLLADAYRSSLELAASYDLTSIAFPSISTGVYHYPLEQAAEIAIRTVYEFCKQESSIVDIRFVLFDQFAYNAYAEAVNSVASLT